MATENTNNYVGTITVALGIGSVTITPVYGRLVLVAVNATNTAAQFTVTLNDEISASYADLDSFSALSRSGGQARAQYTGHGLGIKGQTLTIAISGATVDGTYKYVVRSV